MFDACVNCFLRCGIFRNRLKDEGRALQRFRRICDGEQLNGSSLVALGGKVLRNQVVPVLLNGLAAADKSLFRVTDDRTRNAVANDERRLAGTDGPRAEYCDFFHGKSLPLMPWPSHASGGATDR